MTKEDFFAVRNFGVLGIHITFSCQSLEHGRENPDVHTYTIFNRSDPIIMEGCFTCYLIFLFVVVIQIFQKATSLGLLHVWLPELKKCRLLFVKTPPDKQDLIGLSRTNNGSMLVFRVIVVRVITIFCYMLVVYLFNWSTCDETTFRFVFI